MDASGPQKVWKIGEMVEKLQEKLRKKLGKKLGKKLSVARATAMIDVLPDDVLLQIFDFCREGDHPLDHPLELPAHPVSDWHRQIHVCRRWRQIIFSSPRRLYLYLLCKQGTPVRKNLGLWPAFPIIVHYADYPHCIPKISSNDEDNIIAALEHSDRVRRLRLPATSSLLWKMAKLAWAQEPFPMLTQLWLSSEDGNTLESVILNAFLGGSAPRLREIHLDRIFFPTLPILLSSASDLVVLHLHGIPHNRYILPEAMVASLAVLTRLHDLSIGFLWPPDQGASRGRRDASPTRVVLPVLTFKFHGVSEYLEDLVAQIDAPCLASIQIKYFDRFVFQVPQLFRFIGQTQIVEQAHTMNADLQFYHSIVKMSLSSSGEAPSHRIFFNLQISCEGLGSQVLYMAEALSQSSMVLFNVRHLFILMYSSLPYDADYIEWLALLRWFTAVETLVVSRQIAQDIADALNEATAAIAPELLPALRLLQLGGEGAGCVEEFITTRQLSGLPPITVANTTSVGWSPFDREREILQ